MQDSTIIQPCNMSGFLDAPHFAQFGVVSIDWSNGKQIWVAPPMSCEELLVEQAALLKAQRPGVRVMGYRNIVKALPWFSSVREKMDDPSFASWFLKFDVHNSTPYHVPPCDDNYDPPKCSPFYHDMEQTPNFPKGDGDCPGPCDCGVHPCGEYLFDYSNATNGLADFIVNDFILGPNGLGNENLTGFYLDDEWYNTSMFTGGCSGSPVGGPTEEDTHCLEDMGHAGDIAWTTTVTDTWCDVRHRVFEAARLAGGWLWQMFVLQSTPTPATCAPWIRGMCALGASSPYYNGTVMHSMGKNASLPNFDQDLATFLLLRGDYAFLGFGWSGCGFVTPFPDALKLDYGVPTDFCTETAPNSNVFSREWTKATITMDCNSYKGSVVMK